MSTVKKKPRKSKLVVRNELPMEVQTYQELEPSTSRTEDDSLHQYNNFDNVLLDIKVEKLSDVEESDHDGWCIDTKILVHDVKKEVISVDEEDTEIDGYEDIYIKKEIKEEPTDGQQFYERVITTALNKYKEIYNTDNKLNNFKCSNCNKNFNSINEFQNHLEGMHADETVTVVLEEIDGIHYLVAKPTELDIYNCNCKLIFHSKEQYDIHILKCKKCLQCDICSRSFTWKGPYEMHFLIYHRVSSCYEMPVEVSRCTLCDGKYVGTALLHWCLMKENGVHCKYCMESFQTIAFLNVHLKVMAKIEAKCDKCHLPIERVCQLNHKCVETHQFECTFCSKLLATDAKLKDHILLTHTNHGGVQRPIPTILKRNINILKSKKNNSNGLYLKISRRKSEFENCHHDYIKAEPDYEEQRYNNLMKTIIKDEPMDEDIETLLYYTNKAKNTIKIEAESNIKQEIESNEDTVTENEDINVNRLLDQTKSNDYIRLYKCCRCNFYGVHRDYADHKRICNAKEKRKPTKIECTKCKVVFVTTSAFVSHFVREGCEPLQCFDCDEELDNRTSYENHVYSHLFSARREEGKVTFICNLCNTSLKRIDYYKHWIQHIDIDSAKCESAEQLMKIGKERLSKRGKGLPERLSDDQIKTMYKILTTPKKKSHRDHGCKSCCYCEKVFNRVDYVKIHVIEHLLTDAYLMKQHFKALTCQFCLDSFQTPDLYKLHMRGHGLLRVYQCKLCSKTFSDSSNFSKHKKVHNLLVLVCDLCSKRFASKKMLILHFSNEHRNSKYECRYCDKEFPCSSYYKKHVRLFHLGNTVRYMCAQCKQRFTNLKDKWNHMWKEHGERAVDADCPACDAKFRRYQDLKTHLKENHMDFPDSAKNNVLQLVKASKKKKV